MNSENIHYESTHKTTYDIHSKTMLIAIFSLLFIILLITILHIYARCVLRHPPRNPASTFIHRDLTPQHAESKSGLDPTIISLLPSFQFRHVKGQDDHIECAVCLSMLEEDEFARRLPNCNHEFHMACIDRWLTSQSTCPICRSEATPQLAPLDREPPTGSDQLPEVVVVVTSDSEHDDHDNDMQIVISSDNNNCSSTKNNIDSGSSLSSSFRLSSFRKIISREISSSFSRLHASGEINQQRQLQQ